ADYAVNCIARTLHLELRPWGVPSILIRCGGIETPAAKRVALELARDLAHWPAAQRELYAEALCKLQTQLGSFDRKRTSPGVVAQKVAQALAARRPKRSYLVGHLANWAAFAEMLPQGLVDAVLARLSAGARRCFEEADPPRRPPDRRSD
ncbi:MAG: hypothetical protein ABIK62_06045, partial [candidate division WOR-3 bacterium]